MCALLLNPSCLSDNALHCTNMYACKHTLRFLFTSFLKNLATEFGAPVPDAQYVVPALRVPGLIEGEYFMNGKERFALFRTVPRTYNTFSLAHTELLQEVLYMLVSLKALLQCCKHAQLILAHYVHALCTCTLTVVRT
jgi:hypothetical protein